MKKGGIETIIAAVILVGIVAALLIGTIRSSGSGKEAINTGVGRLGEIENVGMN